MHFPLKLLPENASHSERRIRDAISACSPVGKVHPALSAHSGMQFPFEARSGNGIPLWDRNLGHSFRLRAVPESASHSKRQFRVTASAGTDDDPPPLSHAFKYAIQKHKTADRLLFFGKVHVPKLTKASYLATVHGCRLPPTDSASKNDVKTRPSTCMVRFWSAFGQLSGKFRLIRFCYPKGGGSS